MKATPKSSQSFKTILGASAFALTAGLAVPSFAQTDSANVREDIVVATGSVIRSRAKDFETPSPVQTIDESTFDQTQTQDLSYLGMSRQDKAHRSSRYVGWVWGQHLLLLMVAELVWLRLQTPQGHCSLM